ncbi:MAG: ISL3 family transposase [Verrucomicrobia bacterium]|jgi:transposase|nr:ISL3 family transposase [Verrucomicrobiota bacterium]
MNIDSELQKHYAQLLGVGSPWEVKNVELKPAEKRVEIQLGWQWGADAQCPECGCRCSIHDCAPERTWRHLDTMQFRTEIRARVPRADCPEHGVRTMQVPWAAPHGRFTLLFERFAIEVLLASASVSQGCELLGIGWESAHQIMRRAVERGLERRQLEGLKHLGMDEKSFGRGQSYITLLTDLEQSRVLDVVEDRTAEAAGQLLQTLTPEQKETVEAVAVDMWEPFIRTIEKELPEADIVHDKFHVSKYLGEAVDKVRRQEHKELMARGDETPKGTRQLWLYNPQNLKHHITNAVTEGLNSKIQSIKAAARGFRSFRNYRIRILFFCGKLNLYPL